MTLARLESDRPRFKLVSKPHRVSTVAEEGGSAAWLDWSTELSATELAKIAEKNRPSIVLREAAGAIVYSVGLVVLLMAVLSVLHIR